MGPCNTALRVLTIVLSSGVALGFQLINLFTVTRNNLSKCYRRRSSLRDYEPITAASVVVVVAGLLVVELVGACILIALVGQSGLSKSNIQDLAT